MKEQMNNKKPRASALSKFSALSVVLLVLVAALVIASLFLYINIIRSSEITSGDSLLTQIFMGSPLLISDVLYIGLSLAFIATIFSFVFRWKKSRNVDSRSIYVVPVSSEIIEDKDRLLHRDKSVTDTSRKSVLLDGENRFRGNGGFRGMTGGGFGGGYFEDYDKFDSDGDPE
jgi:hypothetical protein